MSKLYLIDANAYVHRAYHAIPPLKTSGGLTVNAIFGFVRMILKVIKNEKPDYLAICFDYPAKTFRHAKYPLYKATRKAIDEELKNQMPIARQAALALNLTLIEKEKYEADDIIATLARKARDNGYEVVVISGDKDILQLVDKDLKVLNEQKNILFDPEKVREKYGLGPGQLVDMFALMGDASDNIPGVRGIGEKTAVKLIQKYETLENLLSRADEVEGRSRELLVEHRQDAIESKELLVLKDDVELGLDLEDCKLKPLDEEKLTEFLLRYEFTSLVKEIFPGREIEEKTPCREMKFEENTVTAIKDFERLLPEIDSAEILSVDLETDGLDPLKAKIVGIALAMKATQAFYIPVGHTCEGAPEQLSIEEVLSGLKPSFENPRIKKIGHNIKYDLMVLKQYGVHLKNIYFDTMVASYCLNPSNTRHNLKSVALEHLNYKMTHLEELIGKGVKQKTADKVEVEKLSRYAQCDAIGVFELMEKFIPGLKANSLERLFYEIEMPLVETLADMEMTGIRVDLDYLSALSSEFEKELARIEELVYTSADEKFNINSPKQLSVILFEKLKLPVVRKTKTGYSTDEEALKTLAISHELPAKIMEYRELQKLKSTYTDSLLKLANPLTRRIHTSFNQAVTATGRLSSSDPNMQNIPTRTDYGRRIRRAFIADEGCTLVSADYSQIDLRVLAHTSDDPLLLKAFREDADVHTATARELLNLENGTVTEEARRIAKTINFGIVYGISAYGLSQQLKIEPRIARQYIDNYFRKYSGVQKWTEELLRQTRERGFVKTLLGRIRYIPEINSSNAMVRAGAERTAVNTPIQGTSADIIKIAMINLVKLFEQKGYKTKMLLQVHDELLFSVPEAEMSEMLPVIKSQMEKAFTLKIPVRVDLKSGPNWAELKKQ
jgi:DNA polymerase I